MGKYEAFVLPTSMNRTKKASSQVAWSLLTEGVTQARVDLHRLRLLFNRAQALVDQSAQKDHIWQVAGDVIQGLPDGLASAERALDRTSYALSVMGEDFLRGRLPFDDRVRVDSAVKTSPFSGNRAKDSMEARVARRFLQAQHLSHADAAAPSAEPFFFHNPEMREVHQLSNSEAISNISSVAVDSVKDADGSDRTVSKARSEAKKAPPTPTKIEDQPGGQAFSTLNRYIVETEQPGVHGVPEGYWEVPKHPRPKKKR